MKSLFINAENTLRSGWKILGYFLLTAAFGAGLIFARRMLPDAVRPLVSEPLLVFLAALAASWLCARLERTALRDQGFVLNQRAVREFGLGIAGGAGLVCLVAAGAWLLDGFHWVRNPDGKASVLLKSAGTMLAVALFEEMLFHGYAFQRALQGMRPRRALILFSVLFAIAHPYMEGLPGSVILVAMLNTFLAGCLLGLCYLRTRGLALPVGVHLGWNHVLGSLGFGVSGNASKGLWTPVFHDAPMWLTGGAYGLEASVVTLGVFSLAVFALSRWKGTGARVSLPTVAPA
ncbi:CPBP family intramembrane metalloprotease [Pyxidicoccus fallax]|uniref:CPBP family intramembrane metalloprotease n=1 Tax=Pyxidicoccus fallax TaxID=394095 RepID=A0A848LF68_9BACT|nr:CPBP family intramembrane glutamic endopeptidase [Pyxidicoccus fallax]NMO15525.1 CPBP family intramembrane metalloprotease [Pyxidicoccus fallax]NPC78085.1 CPBP family intramembrane metalloprotease [Pyxidicoccus fallax]